MTAAQAESSTLDVVARRRAFLDRHMPRVLAVARQLEAERRLGVEFPILLDLLDRSARAIARDYGVDADAVISDAAARGEEPVSVVTATAGVQKPSAVERALVRLLVGARFADVMVGVMHLDGLSKFEVPLASPSPGAPS